MKSLSSPFCVRRRFDFGPSRLRAPGSLLLAFFSGFCLFAATKNSLAAGGGAAPGPTPSIGVDLDPTPLLSRVHPTPTPRPIVDPDGTWNVDSGGNWSDTTKWLGGIVADGGGFANFSAVNITNGRTITVDSTSRTVRRIDIGDTNNTHSITINKSGAATLIFDNTANSANAQLNQVATSHGDTIAVPFVLNSSLDITNASAATLTLTGATDISAGTAGTKTITTSTGNVIINGTISNGSGVVAIVQNGPGTLTLGTANTFTGGVTINAGTIVAGDNNALGPTASATLVFGPASSGTFQLNGNNVTVVDLNTNANVGTPIIENANSSNSGVLTVNTTNADVYAGVLRNSSAGTGSLALVKSGSGSLTISGANSYSGGTTVNTGTLRATTNATALGTGALTLNGATLELANNTGLNFGRNTTITEDSIIKSDVLTNGAAGVTHTLGTLNLDLNGNGTKGGVMVTIAPGTNVGSGTAGITFGNVTSQNSSPIFDVLAGAQLTIGSFTYSNAFSSNRTYQFEGDGDTIVSGVLHDATNGFGASLVKTGNGTLFLTQANQYTADGSTGTSTGIYGGIVNASVWANGGNNSSIGAAGPGAGALFIGGGTLQYTGSTAATTNRLFTIGYTTGFSGVETATIDASGTGTGTLSFTGTGAIAFDTNNVAHTLILTGSNTGGNTFAPTIGNSGTGATSLTKNGVGTWVLTGANGYTGATTINNGTLTVDNNNTTTARLAGTTNITINSGGTLLLSQGGVTASNNRINDAATMTLNGGTFNTGGLSEHGATNNTAGIGALTLQSSSIINMGTGNSILAFANSSAQTWTGTLSIFNWSGTPVTGNGTDQLYFGNDNTGLTAAQLGEINIYSDNGTTLLGAATILADGEIVPVPEPATWFTGALLVTATVGMSLHRIRRRRALVTS